jgi:hypothetical protein
MLAKRLTFVLIWALFSHKARQKSNIVIRSQMLQFKNWKSNSILLRTYCDQKIWKQQHSQFYLFCSAVVSSCLQLALFNAWLNTFSQTGQSIKSATEGEPIAGPADSTISHMSNTRNTDMGRDGVALWLKTHSNPHMTQGTFGAIPPTQEILCHSALSPICWTVHLLTDICRVLGKHQSLRGALLLSTSLHEHPAAQRETIKKSILCAWRKGICETKHLAVVRVPWLCPGSSSKHPC